MVLPHALGIEETKLGVDAVQLALGVVQVGQRLHREGRQLAAHRRQPLAVERKEARKRPAAGPPVDEPRLRVEPPERDVHVVSHIAAPVSRQGCQRVADVDGAGVLGDEGHLDAQQGGLVLVYGNPQVDVAARLGLEGLDLPEALGAQPLADLEEPRLNGPLLAAAVERVFREERERAHAKRRDRKPVVERLEEKPEDEARKRQHPKRAVDEPVELAEPRNDEWEDDPPDPAVRDRNEGGGQPQVELHQEHQREDRSQDEVR